MPVVPESNVAIEPLVVESLLTHSIGLAVGTGDCGLVVLNVFARLPRVGLACPP